MNVDRLAGRQTNNSQVRQRPASRKVLPTGSHNLPHPCPEAGHPSSARRAQLGSLSCCWGCQGRGMSVLDAPASLMSEHGWAVQSSFSTAASESCCSPQSSGITGIDRNPSCLFFILPKSNKKNVFAGPCYSLWGDSEGRLLLLFCAGHLCSSTSVTAAVSPLLPARCHPVAHRRNNSIVLMEIRQESRFLCRVRYFCTISCDSFVLHVRDPVLLWLVLHL